MRKFVCLGFLVCLFVFSVAAPCPVVFTPSNSFVHLTDESQGLVAYDDELDRQDYVVRQAYEGVASDFGLVLPTPGRPNISESGEDLFKDLNDLTKEPVEDRFGSFGGIRAQSANEGVRVVEKKDVGDFSATVLEANSSEALVGWLKDNDFNYGDKSVDNFEYYVEKDRKYYFTALKINVEEANCLSKERFEMGKGPGFRDIVPEETNTSRCWLRGGLSPIEFSFDVDEPFLPLRIMSRPHDKSPMTPDADHSDHNHDHEDEELPPGNFLVYTLSDQPLTVPGAKVQFSDRIESFPDSLSKYNNSGRFLVRQRIKFNAHKVEEDLVFKEAAFFQVERDETRIVNPSDIDEENGLMEFDGKSLNVELRSSDPGTLELVAFKAGKNISGVVDTLADNSMKLKALSFIFG